MRAVLHTRAYCAQVQSKSLFRGEVLTKPPQHAQLLRVGFSKRSEMIFPRKIRRNSNAKNIERSGRIKLCIVEEEWIVIRKMIASGKVKKLSFGSIESHKVIFAPIRYRIEIRTKACHGYVS